MLAQILTNTLLAFFTFFLSKTFFWFLHFNNTLSLTLNKLVDLFFFVCVLFSMKMATNVTKYLLDTLFTLYLQRKNFRFSFLSWLLKARCMERQETPQTLIRLCQRTTNDWWQWTASFEMSNRKSKHMQTPYQYIRQQCCCFHAYAAIRCFCFDKCLYSHLKYSSYGLPHSNNRFARKFSNQPIAYFGTVHSLNLSTNTNQRLVSVHLDELIFIVYKAKLHFYLNHKLLRFTFLYLIL